MESNAPKSSKSALNFGIMLGLVMMVLSLLIFILELYTLSWINWVTNIILIAGIVYGIKKRRDNELGGSISYGSALGYGTLVSLFVGLISSVFTALYLAFVDDSFIQFTLDKQLDEFYAQGMADEQIDMAIGMTKKFMNPTSIAIMGTIMTVIMGFIVSLIAGAFLKKEAAGNDEI